MSTVTGVQVYKTTEKPWQLRAQDEAGNTVVRDFERADCKADASSPETIWATTKDGKKEIFTKVKTADGKYVYLLCNGGTEGKLPEPPKSVQNPIDQAVNTLGVQKKEKRSF